MTLTCPGNNCPMCRGEACNACVREPFPKGTSKRVCKHDSVERHSAVPAIGGEVDRVPTKPMEPLLAGRIEVDLADSDQAAKFLELVAEIVRRRRRITIIVE